MFERHACCVGPPGLINALFSPSSGQGENHEAQLLWALAQYPLVPEGITADWEDAR